ncbi:2OG-Fe(II) oxygenase [Prescottella defluvii]|nr:2OG-Fe(II) oxygenase [Prescottella defluvii]
MAAVAFDATAIAEIIDLDRYPIDRLDSEEGRRLVERCRDDLRNRGACQLHGFIRPNAVESLVAESLAKAGDAYRTDDTHNVYFEEIPEDAAASDPRGMLQHSSKLTIAWDEIAENSALRTVYNWDPLTDFIGQALEMPSFYRYDDALGACSVALFEQGDELGWHFDRSHFAVTLMLQPTDEGGEYEYFHMLRSPESENHEAVAERLNGSRSGVITLQNEPGTLSFFRGRYSMHRVTPVVGEKTRVNAVLAYSEKSDDKLNSITQKLFYGRTT